MKSGDYMIHVYVSAGKNFKSSEGNESINPVIVVETCGERKYTTAKEDVACSTPTPVQWREHVFFEPNNVHSSKISLDTISIQVLNKGMFRDELIGAYEFDMTYVYFKDKHAVHNQWVALMNPESENFSDIAGNLKVSIAIQGPGDEQVQLSDEIGPES
jgi:hypothetical protein